METLKKRIAQLENLVLDKEKIICQYEILLGLKPKAKSTAL